MGYLFGDKKDPEGNALRKKNAAIMDGGTGDATPKSKDELRAEAARQKTAALADRSLPGIKTKSQVLREKDAAIRAGGTGDATPKSKDELRAEAARQMDGNKSVVEKLKVMGWTPEQAAGITGSFTQESGLDPSARNPTSGAYGIGQWLGSRVADFKKFSGRDLVGSSLDQQLAFFNYEVTEGKEKRAGRLLKGTSTAEEAARVHSQAYERPGAEEANNDRRARLAAQLAADDRMGNAAKVASLPSGATASTPPERPTVAGSTNTTTVSIETIQVQTAATDAAGIAAAMRPAVERYTFANQANSGMR